MGSSLWLKDRLVQGGENLAAHGTAFVTGDGYWDAI